MFFRAIYLNKTTVLIGQSESLPNITGSFGWSYSHRAGQHASGCFSYWNETSGGLEFSGNDTYTSFSFNASKSNSIYGKSERVTPFNASVKIWKRIN